MALNNNHSNQDMDIIKTHESQVRSYSRNFPAVLQKSKDYKVWDKDGNEYIDFFAGAGVLNYGHNNDKIKQALVDYFENDYIVHSLDMFTEPRANFLEKFNEIILKPRGLDYKAMFAGPTGTDAVEGALKLARKVTGRTTIMNFTNGFHGVTLGALAATGNVGKRQGAGVPLPNTVSMPYDGYLPTQESLDLVERYIKDGGTGVERPAAMIFETVQGEGGIHAASMEWIKGIADIAKKYDILLIVDDIQAGNGRTGTFFSFEPAGIYPDIVTVSKSIGGYGMPLSFTLFKEELDIWNPGEHNGTFRGFNPAFIAATEALTYWENDDLANHVKENAELLSEFTKKVEKEYPKLQAEARGRGMFQGVSCGLDGAATEIIQECFSRGLIMETSGPNDEVFKFLAPLIIDQAGLEKGFTIIEDSIQAVLANHS